MSLKITKSKIMIVEGRDEELFFDAVLTRHLRIADVQLLGIGGKTKLTQNLKALANDSGFLGVATLAVIRDADATPPDATTSAAESAFASIRGSLLSARLPCPVGHAEFCDGPPRVGVFVMPDGTTDGMLETLCMRSVAATPEWRCVQDYFACLRGHGVIPGSQTKADSHCWLASRLKPDKRVGEAAQAGYWPFDSSEFSPLWDFLRQM